MTYDLYPRLQKLVEDGKVKIDAKLVDFGFAKFLEDGKTHTLCGT